MSRLEEIKRAYGYDTRLNKDTYPYWLINHIEELQAKVDELEKELEFYADRNSYTEKVSDEWGSATAILQDRGERARQALKGVEG